jgi:hypothetical protein
MQFGHLKLREFIRLLGGCARAATGHAAAQQAGVAVIGSSSSSQPQVFARMRFGKGCVILALACGHCAIRQSDRWKP